MQLDYRQALDALADAVVGADGTGTIVYANRAAEHLLAYPAGEITGRLLTEILPARMHEVHRVGFSRYLSTRQARLIGRSVRVPALRRDGTEVEIELTLSAFRVGEEDLFLGSLRDIGDRVELERQLTISRYLRAATQAAARLTSHLDLDQVLNTVVDALVAEFDAALARVWLYQAATNTLHLRASAGLSRATTTSSRARIDVACYPYKVGEIARSRKPFVKNGLVGDPQFEQDWVEREKLTSVAGFPLLIGAELQGVLIYFSRQEIREEAVEVLAAFASMVASSMNDAQLLLREQEARAVSEAQAEELQLQREELEVANEELQSQQEELQAAVQSLQSRQEELHHLTTESQNQARSAVFLAEVSSTLASSLNYETTLERVAYLAVPYLADWCAVDVVQESGSFHTVAATHVDPAKVEWARELRKRYPPDASATRGVPQVIRTGQPEIYPDIPDSLLVETARDAEHLRILREVGFTSAMILPLITRGRTLGAITVISAESGRRYGPDDLALAKEVARRAAVAIDNARLYDTAQKEITERRRAEEALQEADRRKDDYLTMLAHELRNPLAPILNAVQILKQLGPPDPRLVRAREIIERQGRHQARLIDDLLNVTRIAHGRIELRRERVDLARLVRDAAEDQRGALEEAGLTLTVEAPPEPVWVEGDPTRLSQVLHNLLENAGKFTDGGSRVTVRLAPDAGGRHVSVSVRDTGIGISPDLLPHVFETFIQGDRSLDRTRGGLGLGLALVKGLVELHGGEVRASSEGPGRGAEFTFVLPLGSGAAQGQASGSSRAAAQPRRALVVEDNRDAADTLRDLLELLGHEVDIAYSGPAGVEAARRFRPDVVLCDLGLPKMDGYQVARALRQDPGTASARLIAVSGYGQEEDQCRSREAGFDLHLTKPVDPARLQQVLELAPELKMA